MPDWTFYRHSGIYACPLLDPCCTTKAVLCVHVHAACPCPCCMSMSILHVHVHAPCLCQYPCTYIEMPECWTVRHLVSPVPDWKKLMMPEQVRYRTKLTQSGIFLARYRTKIWDAGMPMPVLVSSMPMPSYCMLITHSILSSPTTILNPHPIWPPWHSSEMALVTSTDPNSDVLY
jgi:hypothetical protein